MSDCRNGGRDVYKPVCTIEVEFEGEGRAWGYPLALNGRRIRRVTIGGVEYVPFDLNEKWVTGMIDGHLKVVAIELGGTRFEPVQIQEDEREEFGE